MRTVLQIPSPAYGREARLEQFWRDMVAAYEAKRELAEAPMLADAPPDGPRETPILVMDAHSRAVALHRQATDAMRQAHEILLKEMWLRYVDILTQEQPRLLKLGFALGEATINVYALVDDLDRDTRLKMFGIASRASGPYWQFGISVDAGVVHPCERCPLPFNYKVFRDDEWRVAG